MRSIVVLAATCVAFSLAALGMPRRAGACVPWSASAASIICCVAGEPGSVKPSAAGGGEAMADVRIQAFSFSPAEVIVPIGASVRWTDVDLADHTVTSQSGPGAHSPSGLFDSGPVNGVSYMRAFNQLGDYWYYCQPHAASMEGVVRVRLAADATGDRRVDIADFSVLAANFNQTDRGFQDGDFNLTGTVEIADFAILAVNFNTTAGFAGGRALPVPEAAATGGLMGLAILRRRRARGALPRVGDGRPGGG